MSHLPFCGDPQPIIKVNGLWHFYYLYNVDFPGGNGTAWKHATSHDLIHWHDAGIAIPKYTTPYGDPWSGSLVIDHDNRAGFGANAIIALCTMPLPSGQGTVRWVSKDDGNNFTIDRPIMTNPTPQNNTIKDKVFRDPRIVWLEKEQYWVMALAEIGKIGFYRSDNLADWSYLSGFMHSDLGTLECPTLFPITLRDHHGQHKGTRWILLCSANGFQGGFTTGAHYWAGEFDGQTFTPDTPNGRWLDAGSDFYACAIWGDHPLTSQPHEHYYAIAWKNNWDYANQLPQANYYGDYTRVRTLTLRETHDGMALTNNFIEPNALLQDSPLKTFHNQIITADKAFSLPITHAEKYVLSATLATAEGGHWPHDMTITLQSGMGTPLTIILSPERNNINLQRNNSGFSPSQDKAWTAERNAPFEFHDSLCFTAIINANSIEIVFNDGLLSFTSVVFPQLKPASPQMTVSNHSCIIKMLSITNV